MSVAQSLKASLCCSENRIFRIEISFVQADLQRHEIYVEGQTRGRCCAVVDGAIGIVVHIEGDLGRGRIHCADVMLVAEVGAVS